MALARVKVWVAGEILTAADLNGEFNNILNNPTALISPFTANLNANGKQITNLALENLGASPAAGTAGRVWFNTATTVKQAEVDDGAFIRAIPSIKSTSISPGDILYAIAGSSQGGNPSWANLAAVTSSQAGGVPLVQTTSAPMWGTALAHAWIVFNGSATSSGLTATDGFGFSTAANAIIHPSSGVYQLPLAIPFANANYSLHVLTNEPTGRSIQLGMAASSGNLSSEAVIRTWQDNGGGAYQLNNPSYISVMAIGRV